MTQSQLKDSMYETLAGDVVTTDKKETAYTVRIDDFTVTLATMEEVSELLEKVKDKYSDSKGFTVELNRHELHGYVAYTTNFVSADKTVNDAAQVLSSQNGTSNLKDLTKDDIVFTEGVISVEFVENIEIIETKQSKADVLTVEEASRYFAIGINKLREFINNNREADYLEWQGRNVFIRRKAFEQYLDRLTEFKVECL